MVAMKRELRELVERAAKWPEETQAELVEIGREIGAKFQAIYHPSSEELEAIDQASSEIERGEAISEEDAEAIFAERHHSRPR